MGRQVVMGTHVSLQSDAGAEGRVEPELTTGADVSFVAAVAPLAAVPDQASTVEGAAPRVVFVGVRDGELARRAAEYGIEPTLVEAGTIELAVSLALEQVLELQKLRATYGRLRLVERAKGILMERHRISERGAYELLHRQARNTNLRLSEVAEAVAESHLLLSGGEAPRGTGPQVP
jgi:two-component system, response regulator / RNA-binding antiterminator